MRRTSSIWLVSVSGVGLGVMLSACASTQEGAESAAIPPSEETLALGAGAYRQAMCFKCHGDDGRGTARGPDLTDSEWLHTNGSVAGIETVMRQGVSKEKMKDSSRPFGMNPVTNMINDDATIEALAVYVKSLSTS